MHYQALTGAANAAHFGNLAMLQRAYAMNGFADHFLTDSFAAGHIRVPRLKIIEFYQNFFDQHLDSILNYVYRSVVDEMMVQLFHDNPNVTGVGLVTDHNFCEDNRDALREFKKQVEDIMKSHGLSSGDLKKLLTQYVAGAVSKVLHDDENSAGLNVKSKKHPEGWKAYGDGKLDATGEKYVVEAVQVSKNELMKAFNLGLDSIKETDPKLFEKVKPWVYPVSMIEDYIPDADATNKPLPEWRIDPGLWDMMDRPMQDKLGALVRRYLTEKKLEEILANVPKEVEKEVDWSPNVTVRPRDAVRIVIQRFRANPADFLASAAAAPADFKVIIGDALLCHLGMGT